LLLAALRRGDEQVLRVIGGFAGFGRQSVNDRKSVQRRHPVGLIGVELYAAIVGP
jgi:hypothetical protein